jgi:serine/threonine protein kinase
VTEQQSTSVVAPGDVIAGKYRVDRVIGVGGMGVVVAATHLELERSVALKFALPTLLESPAAVERFLREARAAVRLRSEHVARVMDVGKLPSGPPYMVMELLEGTDLGAVLHDGPLSVETAADYLVQTCEALAEAHSLGIIHRDLKPANLFVTRSVGGAPLIKVLDFGISKVTKIDGVLTTTSALLGSPLYMAPEQMRSARSADTRSDVWALGIILYQALSGRVPFLAETLPELCLKVVHDTPPLLTELRSDVPAGLAAIVAKCIEKDPNGRYQSVADLASALEQYAPASTRHMAARARSVLSSSQRTLEISSPSVAGPDTVLSPHQPLAATLPESGGERPAPPALVVSAPLPVPLPSVSQSTNDAVVSLREPEPRPRTPMFLAIAGAIFAVSVIAVGATFALRPAPAATPPPPPTPVETATPPVPTANQVAPTAEPSASAVASATPSPTTSAITARPPHPARQTPPASPSAAPPAEGAIPRSRL